MIRLSIDHRQVEVPAGGERAGGGVETGHRRAGPLLPRRLHGLDLLPGVHGEAHGERPLRARLRHGGGRWSWRWRARRPKCISSAATRSNCCLSDHLGDCLAPCWFACPAQMDIPQMLRQIAAGELREAIATVKTRHRPAGRVGAGLPGAVRKGLPPRRARRGGGHLPT